MYPARNLSRPWLAHIRLNLVFPQPIATAIGLSPARRADVSVRRHDPGCWCNLRAKTGFYHLPTNAA